MVIIKTYQSYACCCDLLHRLQWTTTLQIDGLFSIGTFITIRHIEHIEKEFQIEQQVFFPLSDIGVIVNVVIRCTFTYAQYFCDLSERMIIMP